MYVRSFLFVYDAVQGYLWKSGRGHWNSTVLFGGEDERVQQWSAWPVQGGKGKCLLFCKSTQDAIQNVACYPVYKDKSIYLQMKVFVQNFINCDDQYFYGSKDYLYVKGVAHRVITR